MINNELVHIFLFKIPFGNDFIEFIFIDNQFN